MAVPVSWVVADDKPLPWAEESPDAQSLRARCPGALGFLLHCRGPSGFLGMGGRLPEDAAPQIRRGSAGVPLAFRTRSAGVPPAFRRRSAPVPHSFRTRSAPVPHAIRTGADRFRTGAAPVPPPFRSLRHGSAADLNGHPPNYFLLGKPRVLWAAQPPFYFYFSIAV